MNSLAAYAYESDAGLSLPSRPEVFLGVGAVACGRGEQIFTTVLGSCVSVCLFDGISGISGMNHFMLPEVSPAKPSTFHGPVAIRVLLKRMIGLGATPRSLTAKVFGGGSPMGVDIDIGDANVAMALDMLERNGIPVVGGRTGTSLRLHMLAATGEVWGNDLASCGSAQWRFI